MFLGGAECPVSETYQGLDRMPRTQVPAKLPGLSPVVNGLALLPLPALGLPFRSEHLASYNTSIP